MKERQDIRVTLVSKSIYGSVSQDDKYEHDTVLEFISWLQEQLAKVPKEYRQSAYVEVDSIGGYEGEHHAEIEVYYCRPETDEEINARIEDMRAYAKEEAKRHTAYAAAANKRLRALED